MNSAVCVLTPLNLNYQFFNHLGEVKSSLCAEEIFALPLRRAETINAEYLIRKVIHQNLTFKRSLITGTCLVINTKAVKILLLIVCIGTVIFHTISLTCR